MLSASPGLASNKLDLNPIVNKLVADINKGNFSAVVAACAPRAAVVDGFMKSYRENNAAIHATLGTLSIGKPLYTEVRSSSAYAIYPVTFTDAPNGKKATYKGTMTVTLEKTQSGWVFTGVASAWTS